MPDCGVHPGLLPMGPEPFWPGLVLNPALGLLGGPAFPWHRLSQYMLQPFLPPPPGGSSPPRTLHLHPPSPDDLRPRSRAASQSPQGVRGPTPPQSHSPLDARKSSSIDNLRLAAREHARREAMDAVRGDSS